MLNLTEQKATLAELELLVAVRCRVLRAANQLPEDTPLPEVESQTRTYYQKAFAENITLKEACVALGFLTAEKFDEVFHPEEMV